MTQSETPDPLAFLFGGTTDTTLEASGSTAPDAPSAPVVSQAPVAPVYRSRREMRAAGGYLSAAPSTSSIPVVPAVPVAPAVEAPGVDAFAAMFGQTSPARDLAAPIEPAVVPELSAAEPDLAAPDLAAPDLSLPRVEAPTTRRALRAAQTSYAASTRPPRDRGAGAAKSESTPREASASQQRRKLRERLTAAGVMVLVGGLFAALALPAYADSGSGGVALVAARSHGSQALGVDGSLDKAGTGRDDYSATSAEDLAALYASAVRQKNLTAFLASGSASQGNDYPWPSELSRNQGGGLSPLNYYYRECVDFVAWRLSRDAGSSPGGPYRWTWSQLTPNGGNASQWLSAWQDHGWPTGSTPKVGSVAWFPGGNHVAYVSGILSSGMIVIDEYNWGGTHEYDQRVIDPSTVTFLYAPPA